MELRLNGYGIIEITNATLVDGGDILIEAADHFEKLAETTNYEIAEVYLTETEYGYGIVAVLNTPEQDCFIEDSAVFDIENQEDIYKLNALL